MASVTAESVDEWGRALVSGANEEREQAARMLAEAVTHHDVQVCVAAYTTLRRTDPYVADRQMSQLIERMRLRAGGEGATTFRRSLCFLFLFGVIMFATRNYTFEVRALCAAFAGTVFIGANFGAEAAKEASQKDLKQVLDLLSQQTGRDLAPLLPDFKRIAAFQNGKEAKVRQEASQLVARIETVLREEGALPLPAEPEPLPDNELPRPSSGKATEHPTPNA
jgi:hypothetical protein